MDYNRVALFVRVVRTGSFTAAAAAAGLPKSSVSRSVSHLEKELGVRLLQRTTRQLALTDAGQSYYDAVQGAVARIEEADLAARELGAEPRGRVRIAAPPDFGEMEIAEGFARFCKKHPGIHVELALGSRFVDLVAEGFDLAIRAGRLEDSSLIVRRIGSADAALFGAPSYLRRRGRPKSLAELVEHDWVLYRGNDGRGVLRLSRDGKEESVEVSGAILADELGFCARAAEAGAGLVMLPIQLAAPAVVAGRLEHILPEYRHIGATVQVVLPSSRQIPLRVALVRDFLVDHLTQKLAESQLRCQKAGSSGSRNVRRAG
jgi:DNA-binding transcriptional LysR family regulator